MSYLVFGCTEKEIVLQEVDTESMAQKLSYRYCKHDVYGFYVNSSDYQIAQLSVLLCSEYHASIVCAMRCRGSNKASLYMAETLDDVAYYIDRFASEKTPFAFVEVYINERGMPEVVGTNVGLPGKVYQYDEYNQIVRFTIKNREVVFK